MDYYVDQIIELLTSPGGWLILVGIAVGGWFLLMKSGNLTSGR